MKITLYLLILACTLSCGKSNFDIDPSKVYAPSQLIEQATGKCNTTQPWEGKTVSVAGRVDQLALYERQNGGKFKLRDENGSIEVYVEGASPQAIAGIYRQLIQGASVTVTGKAVAWDRQTQAKCRKSIYIAIDRVEAIDF